MYYSLISSMKKSSVDADAQAFITAAAITNATQQTAINSLVVSLKSYGIWTKIKALYPMVGGTAASHKFNLKDPRDLDAAFRLTFSGGWTHSNTGALPNGTNGYADTKFIPLTNFSLNNGHISHYNRTNSSGVKRDISATAAIGTSTIYSYSSLDGTYNYSRITGNEITYLNNDTRGLFILNRISTVTKYYKNNLLKITSSSSATMADNIISIGGSTTAFFSNREYALASIGDGLTDTEASNFYTAIQTYQTTLGRQV